MARLVVVTGPSGVGKGTLISRLISSVDGLVMSVSATTRRPRPGEVDGRNYHFISDEQFDQRLADGEFLESAAYAGNRYGTLLSEVNGRPSEIRGVVLEIETIGAAAVKEKVPEAIRIFIAPPNEAALRERLVGRATDTPSAIEERLATSKLELARQGEFDVVIVNDEVDKAATELAAAVRTRLD